MQHKTHNQNTAARFYVSTRGQMVDRKAQRTAHTGYSMGEQNVTRSELQALADMLNEPEARLVA